MTPLMEVIPDGLGRLSYVMTVFLTRHLGSSMEASRHEEFLYRQSVTIELVLTA